MQAVGHFQTLSTSCTTPPISFSLNVTVACMQHIFLLHQLNKTDSLVNATPKQVNKELQTSSLSITNEQPHGMQHISQRDQLRNAGMILALAVEDCS